MPYKIGGGGKPQEYDSSSGRYGSSCNRWPDSFPRVHKHHFRPIAGKDYNIGGKVPANEIGHPVDIIEKHSGIHRRPEKGSANSVYSNYDKGGKLEWERYYDKNGNPYLDVDYSDHGNPKIHSVPHYHRIWIDDKGKIHREEKRNV